jgi:hypothetical protein
MQRGRLAGILDPGGRRAQVGGDLALLERPLELLARVLVLHRDQVVEHLDDGDLRPEVGEDRCELDADDSAAQDGQPLRHLPDLEQAGGVEAARPSMPSTERTQGLRPGATIAD